MTPRVENMILKEYFDISLSYLELDQEIQYHRHVFMVNINLSTDNGNRGKQLINSLVH